MSASKEWTPADALNLEPNALSAATEKSRNLALTAGPGAGKTEMLAQRADFLLRSGHCRYPRRILAISFKTDASQNLKDRVTKRCGSSLATRFDSYTFHAFAKRLIDKFRPVLSGLNELDPDYEIGGNRVFRRQVTFDDLVPLAIEILSKSPEACNALRQTYSDVFLDEFQDCTTAQYQLIKKAFNGTTIRLTAVGDTKQRIMGWAGALEGIFLNFAKDFNARGLNLYQNFRALPRLRRMQNELVKVMDPVAALTDSEIIGDEGEIQILDFKNCDDEAVHVSAYVKQLIEDKGVPCSEIAVLLSKQSEFYCQKLTAELQRLHVPCRNEQSFQDLACEPITQLIINFLSVIFGDREPDAYMRLLSELDDHVSDDDSSTQSRESWRAYIHTQRLEAIDARENDKLSETWTRVLAFLNKVGRAKIVAMNPEYETGNRLSDLVNQTKQRLFELFKTDRKVSAVISHFSSVNNVRIMTIHKSKGLEFDTVIFLGVERETFWGNPDAERCAYFVGISRAKRRLILTSSLHRARPNGMTGRWEINRQRHIEYLNFAASFTD